MAGEAIVRKISRDMIGVGHPSEIALMARVAIRRRAGVLAVAMTYVTGHGLMRAGERKTRAAVVKQRRPPRRGIMARRAIMRKLRREM